MIIKTILMAKKRDTQNKPNVSVDNPTLESYVKTLQKLLQCKTVYSDDGVNAAEYKRFYDVIKREFPTLHSKGEAFNLDGCLVYKVAGKGNKNILLMSHHDVVEGSENWKYPPFGAEIHDGKIYARGSIDTKTPFFAELQAVEELLNENFDFPYNVYIASSNNEEVSGNGIFNALEYFKQNKIKFEFILDEGGAIVDKMVPGVKEKCAMIAVHEKGRHGFRCVAKKDVKKDGGHSGLTCKTDSPIVRMSEFISEIEKTKWTTKLYPEVKATFIACAPYMPFSLRFVFANINLFEKPLLKIMPKISSAAGGMLGTSVYFTRFNTDGTENIQAKEAVATAFFRCVREEDLKIDVEKFTAVANKYGVEVSPTLVDYCPPTTFDSKEFKYVKSILKGSFPAVVSAPFLLTAGTDARRLHEVSDNILRFAPISLSQEQFATVHSDNENIDVASVGEAVSFYKSLISNVASLEKTK